jgi:hypothetical protein
MCLLYSNVGKAFTIIHYGVGGLHYITQWATYSD